LRRIVLAVLVILAVTPIAGAAGAAHGSSELPTVSGKFDQSPTIAFPKIAAPKTLSATVLEEGSGPIVKSGELLVVNYYGQIWRGKVFSQSFDQPIPDAFQIGVKGLIAGWNKTLVGRRIGSRLLLVVPPADAYGKKGQSSAGITGTDTLVFVIDLLGAYGPRVGGDPNAAVLRTGTGGVSVSGSPTTPPKVSIAKKAAKPTAVVTTVLDRGHGAKLKAGLVVLQAVVVNWKDKVIDSTWKDKVATDAPVGIKSEPSLLDPLLGTPLGSRALILTAGSTSTGPIAIVVDLVAEPKGTAAQSK
jgi:peptidylprolyl isomerase